MGRSNELLEWIRENIRTGALTADEKLPTEAELSDKFSMTRYSVRKTLEMLEQEGILYKIQGSGSYVSGNARKAAVPAVHTGSNIIGLVLRRSDIYIFPDVIRGVSEELAKNGYPMSLYITDGNFFKEREAINSLMELNPAGIIIEPASSLLVPYNDDFYRETAEKTALLMIHSGDIEGLNGISVNDRAAARILTKHLIDNGHKKIGAVLCSDEQTGSMRYLGFLDEMNANGLICSNQCVLWNERSTFEDIFRPDGNHTLENMLKEATAVMCQDDRVANSLINYLRSTGRRVPEDISVVGYDDVEIPGMDIKITTIAHPKVAYGANAAQAIIKLINNPAEFDRSDYEIEPKLIVGDSVRSL